MFSINTLNFTITKLPLTKKTGYNKGKTPAPNISHSPIMMSPLEKKLPITKEDLCIFSHYRQS